MEEDAVMTEEFIEEKITEENDSVENIEEKNYNDEQTKKLCKDEEKKKTKDTNIKSILFSSKSFFTRVVISVVLLLLALFAMRPTGNGGFYIAYYVIFGCFSIGVLCCCFVAQMDISFLCDFYEKFKKSRGRREDLVSEHEGINKICIAYKESFLLNETYNKTRSNADLYFGGETYFNDMNKLPIQSFLKIIPGTFIGFGILGTFIGFAEGLKGLTGALSNQDTALLMKGVGLLIDGLSGAFNTSIVGVLASMFFNFVMIHPLINKLDQCCKLLCDYLDTKFFVSEVDAMSVTDEENRQIPFPQTMGIILDKLEQVASNINQIGATVGDQVTQSVKETLDKTIEIIIREEIRKLKEEMNSSINLLKECQKHLQNAPAHLKEAAEKMKEAAEKNDELFRRQNQESVEILIKTIEDNLTSKFASYASFVQDASEEMLDIKNALSSLPESFTKIEGSIRLTSDNLSKNQEELANALKDSSEAFTKTIAISESLTTAYDSQCEKIDTMISKFNDILKEYRETSKESHEIIEGFKGLDAEIANIFERINENTKSYSTIVGDSLSGYLKNFSDSTKDVSKKFADATDALREEVEKFNKSLRSKQ